MKLSYLKPILLTLAMCAFSPLAQAQDNPVDFIYHFVLINNSAKSAQQCSEFANTLKHSPDKATLQQSFSDLVQAWKAVETTYMLGSVAVETIDYPQLIDVFHRGNEKLEKALERALAGDNAPEKALYKNSYKSINALEYLLFGVEQPSARRQQLLTTITDNLCNKLELIAQAYVDNADKALSHGENGKGGQYDKTTAYLLNSLVESAYKTREWRVGDAAGLSRKYQGNPDPRRQEYYLSGASLPAIEAILKTHERMIGDEFQPNFATYARENGAHEALEQAQQALMQAQNALTQIQQAPKAMQFEPKTMRPLFDALDSLQTAYYKHLLKSLDVVAKILDADGD